MKSVIERYYHQYFITDVTGRKGEDQYLNQHTNGLCIVGIAPTHPIVTKELQIKEIHFSYFGDPLKNKVIGKYKKGGTFLSRDLPFCDVTLEDDSVYKLYSCVSGSLLELNESIKKDPQLLVTKASTEGFLAIITPKEDVTQISDLKTQEQYCILRGLPLPE